MNSLFIVFFVNLITPLFLLGWLAFGRFKDKVEWISFIIFAINFVIWVFISGRWDWISIYLRYVLLIILALGLILSFIIQTKRKYPLLIKTNSKISNLVQIAMILLFAYWNFNSILGNFYNSEAINLEFPLKSGSYYIGHGGSTKNLNNHNSVPAQKFGLDINKLSSFGNRANSFTPKKLEDYPIFGDKLFSPCDGKVLHTKKDLIDVTIDNPDSKNLVGNHIWLRCEKSDVLMAHLKNNSIIVNTNDLVKTGQPIGEVGNSGNTTAPHLHIHAQKQSNTRDIKNGTAVPMLFNKKFLVRNDIISK